MSAQPLAPAPALTLLTEQPQHSAAIEALLDRAFGPGRFVKSSERVREIADFAPELSFCAFEDGELLGVVRQWRVRVGETPVVFLGPLAVETGQRSAGLGGLLVERACEAAKAVGEAGVLLVGDVAYFTRFGFESAPAKGAILPGPVDQRRVMALLFDASTELAGPVRGR
ncbi:GNAT family N-acetyltransferase [Phenylobacterium deserti]|uniref:N-acetyltransferase n=1 Tax=Phenylobacterium deserti TaxID=1914756 RepID=A0A328ATS7_9CAUL|nr:N-acetyltransferase [Phenylobacterium deserti]RAK57969.1 N-acetyltransferase [Phenylobacterium deserti]